MAQHHGLFEAFFVARIVQQQNGGKNGGTQRGALFCRFEPPGARGVAVPAADNLLPFCWPLGVDAVKPSPYLVTCEFSFTLTGGDGQRLHGFCRKTHDTTHDGSREQKRFPQVLCILSQHCWSSFFNKTLEVVDQLLAPQATCLTLPPDAPAALFMASLPRLVAAAGPAQPPLGAVLRVPLPLSGAPISVDRMRVALAGPGRGDLLLGLSPDFIELEVPPHLGNSTANAGISLARLLWFLTPRQAVTLVASLLLERRIILVARDAETVSAAVHAASALLYPFKWQHIYLPLLPLALKDYLAAPMPYLAGVQAECLPLLRSMQLEEVVMIDLDCLGSCTPELGSPGDDYFLLPHARELEDVFEVVREHIKSPTEFDSSPKCTELLQDFFLRLVGRYRQFVRPDEDVTPAALALGLDRPVTSTRSSQTSSKGMAEECSRAHGYLFDQAAFIAAHRRKPKVCAFLQQFRNSQMLEVFITERLKLAAEGYVTEDPFELLVTDRNTRASMRLGIGGGIASGMGGGSANIIGSGGPQKGRISSLLRKAGSAVKQSGGSVFASIQRLGTSQQEEHQVAGRAHSGPNLSRLSPGPNGLARFSPAIGAAAVVAHSRNSSFSSRPGSRSSSYSNLQLSRASANLAVVNGGVEPSLEQLRADMFFGADDDEDSSSVETEASVEVSAAAARQAAHNTNSPGPLEKAMGATRSFGSIFHAAAVQQPAPSSLSPLQPHHSARAALQQQQQGQQQGQQRSAVRQAGAPLSQSPIASGSSFLPSSAPSIGIVGPLGSMRGATASPPGGYAGSRAAEHALPSAMLVSAGATGTAAAAAAASPASLIDLHSPGPQEAGWQHNAAQRQPYEQPQARPQQLFPDATTASLQPRSVQRSSSNQGWAHFSDSLEVPPVQQHPSPQSQQGSGRAAAAYSPPVGSGVGPLGAAMSGAAMPKSISLPPPDSTPAWERVQQVAAATAPLPQQAPLLRRWLSSQPQPSSRQQQQQQLQQQVARQQQQQASMASAMQSRREGVTTEWGPQASPGGGQASRSGHAAASQVLPAACRHTAHSPLAQGMGDVKRLAGLGQTEADTGVSATMVPRRGSSSGTSVVAAVGLHIQHDAFADVAAAAAVNVSEHMSSLRHTSSGDGGGGNPFKESAGRGQQQGVPLSSQVTAGGRTLSSASSFGEWAGAWAGGGDGPLGSGARTTSVQLPMGEPDTFPSFPQR